MPFLYGIYIEDEQLQLCLDLLRLIAEPGHYRRAHITVRGPYERKVSKADIKEMNTRFQETKPIIRIFGCGRFFSPGQNTVYLPCDVNNIEAVWRKKDYPDSVPHITVFDGKNRRDAEIFHAVLSRNTISIETVATKITLISKKEDLSSTLPLLFDKQDALLSESVGRGATVKSIGYADLLQRSIYMTRLLRYMRHAF